MKNFITFSIFIIPSYLFCNDFYLISLAGKIDFSISMSHSSEIYMTKYIDDSNYYYRDLGGPSQENFLDLNLDGTWTPAETYVDANLNGQWDDGEAYSDNNLNGVYDTAEIYYDNNGNGVWDDWVQTDELELGTYSWDPEAGIITYINDLEGNHDLKHLFISKISDAIYTYVANGFFGIIYDENLDLDKDGFADKEQFAEMQNVEFFFGDRSTNVAGPSLVDIMRSPYLVDYLNSVNALGAVGAPYQLNTYQSSDLNNWELIDTKSIQRTEESLYLKSELSID